MPLPNPTPNGTEEQDIEALKREVETRAARLMESVQQLAYYVNDGILLITRDGEDGHASLVSFMYVRRSDEEWEVRITDDIAERIEQAAIDWGLWSADIYKNRTNDPF